MTISEESSTFEFARDWLVSSEALVRDAFGIDLENLDESRDAARLRIHSEEANDEPNEAEANETTPDLPPSVNSRPRAIVRTESDRRRRAGTGTWAGEGELLIDVEVDLPAEFVINPADDTNADWAEKFKGAREWARRLSDTIRTELMDTSGSHDGDGAPYLNATDIDFEQRPSFAENEDPNQFTWMGWTYRVPWN